MKNTCLLPWIAAAALVASASVHASEPRGRTALASSTPTASTAFTDAKTGELRPGTAQEQADLIRLRTPGAWPATEEEAATTKVLHSNGMISMLVPTDRMVHTRASVDAEGNVTVTHFDPDHGHGHEHNASQELPHE